MFGRKNARRGIPCGNEAVAGWDAPAGLFDIRSFGLRGYGQGALKPTCAFTADTSHY